MLLKTFSYRYAASGDKGGLKVVSFTFQPFDADAVTDRAEMKRITRDNFERMRGVCDDMLRGKPFKCKCKPDFSDSPSESKGGYVYEGMIGGLSTGFQSLHGSVHFTLGKTPDEQISIDAMFLLTHDGNIKIMNALLALPNIEVDPGAQQRIDDLRKLLDRAGDADAKVTDLLGLEADDG